MSEDTQVVEKLDAISSFCSSKGHDVSNITTPLKERISDAGEKVLVIIDKIWSFVKENKEGPPSTTDIIISGIKIVSCSFSIVGFVFPPASLVGYSLTLIACILRIVFEIIDIKSTLAPEKPIWDEFSHELGGLAQRLINAESLFRNLESMAHVQQAGLDNTLSNVDRHIGIDELGNLKSRIEFHMCDGRDNAEKSLHYLNLYVRISTLRQALLLRISSCLKAKDYDPTTRNLIKQSIKEERERDKYYLRFLSVPSLKAIKIAALFDPNEHKELAAYMEELTLPLQDLRNVLHGRVLIMQPQNRDSIVLGRPSSSFSSVRAMKSKTDINNVRIRFKFSVIENTHNVFHIQSPDLQDYVYMKKNGECKYRSSSGKPRGSKAEWKIIYVHEEEEEHGHSTFVLSTRAWPCRFLYVDKSPLKCGRGYEEKKTPQEDILFKLVCPEKSPVNAPVSLTPDQDGQKKNNEDTNQHAFKRNDPNSELDSFPELKQIWKFLEENHLRAKTELIRIEEYLLKSDDTLVDSIKEIASCVELMKDKTCYDRMMCGVRKLICVNNSIFTERYPYESISTQLLRICGLILSSTWHIDRLDDYVSHYSGLKSYISKDIQSMERFAVCLRKIENAENISEKNITQIINDGKLCKEIESLYKTSEEIECIMTKNAKAHVSEALHLMITFMRIAIIQLVKLWQMYALANFPGHSEKDAETVHCIILLQRKNDQKLIETFCRKYASSMSTDELSLFKDHSKCLGFDLDEHDEDFTKTNRIGKISLKRTFQDLYLVIRPNLETILENSFQAVAPRK